MSNILWLRSCERVSRFTMPFRINRLRILPPPHTFIIRHQIYQSHFPADLTVDCTSGRKETCQIQIYKCCMTVSADSTALSWLCLGSIADLLIHRNGAFSIGNSSLASLLVASINLYHARPTISIFA